MTNVTLTDFNYYCHVIVVVVPTRLMGVGGTMVTLP